MLSVIVALRNDLNFRGYQEGRVESDTELTNQVEISFFDVFQILLRSSTGYRSQITDELVLCHTDSIIDDFDYFSVFIILNFDLEFCLISQDIFIVVSKKSEFIESVRGIRDELSQEDFFLCVKRVDDDIHESEWSERYLPTSASNAIFSASHLAPHSEEMRRITKARAQN